MGNNIFTPAGAYPHNPFVGDRPMKYPYTMSAKIAQFPFVYHWRYMLVSKAIVCSFLLGIPVFWKLQKLSFTPSNVEEWKERRKEWYTPKRSPEYDLY